MRWTCWVLLGLQLVQGWQGTCFMNGAHMAHCCEQPERCFGPDKDIKDKTHEDCCGSTFQELLKKSVAKELRETEDVDGLKEIYSVTEAFLNFVNYADIAAWELLAQAAGKRALAEYNAFSTFTDDMVSGNFDEERFKQRKMYVIKDVNHAAHLIENFFQALWYDHAHTTARSAVETDINDVRPKFRNVLKVYEVVQTAADRVVYGPDAQHAKSRAASLFDNAPEIVLVVNVVGPWASVGIVTFWSILRHRTTPLRVFIFGDQLGIRDWRAMMRTVKFAAPQMIDRVRFDYIDIFQHPRMIAYFSRLPSECATSNMSKALYARLLCHELLPRDVERAIAIDLGDILVFDDIRGLWDEGDHLQTDEFLAAASHRSAEETMRKSKPSDLNGGVVLYEVSRMRQGNYTEDTLRAAKIGLEKGYEHFCVWDQDIINAMREDLWGHRGVRILPCRWSIFPLMNWQFFWNTPEFWLSELVQMRRYPGLLSADHLEHFCPQPIQMLHTVFAFESREQRQLARNIALAQGIRNTQPGGATRSPDGSSCACGERASLLHVPSTMKLWPWVQKLFRFHRPSFLPPVDDAALFRSRSEQSRDIGGGFWGSEDSKDLESMNHGTLRWAMDRGLSVITGNCCTMATSLGNYARGEFPKQKMEDTAATSAASRTLRVKVETNAAMDAYIFIGEIFPISHALQSLGLEFVIDAMGKRSMMRWGMQGEEIASYEGRLLTGQWSKFWVEIHPSGRVLLNWTSGELTSSIFDVSLDLFGTYDITRGNIYAGSLGEAPAQFLLCRE